MEFTKSISQEIQRNNTPISLKTLITAYRRGWNQTQIAFAAGVSHQAVQQRILKYERKFGPVERGQEKIRPHKKIFWSCDYCGKSMLTKIKLEFCSKKCAAARRREISDEKIKRSIALRGEGKSWRSVSRITGFPVQSIQKRIWIYLHLSGQLNDETASIIWNRPGRGYPLGRPPSWRWLEKSTGIYSTKFGTRMGRRYEQKPPRIMEPSR
jgi:hypothetical protein